MNKKTFVSVVFSLLLVMACVFSVSAVNFDVNKDDNFNISDVTALQMHLAEYDVDVNVIDANCDGRVNIKDASYMQKVLSTGDVIEPDTNNTQNSDATNPTEETTNTNDNGIGKDSVDVEDIL